MRIIPETPALTQRIQQAGIPERFTYWERYRRRLLACGAGEQMMRAGDRVDCFSILLSGSIRVYSLGREGKLLTLIVCRPDRDTLLGDVEYLTGDTSPNFVEAVEDSVLLQVPYDREWMEKDIALYHFLSEMLLQKMQMSSENATRMALYSLPQRFAWYLLAASDGRVFTGSYGDAAGYLGCSYRQLMRIAASFYQEGILRREGKTTRILDTERLRQLADGK